MVVSGGAFGGTIDVCVRLYEGGSTEFSNGGAHTGCGIEYVDAPAKIWSWIDDRQTCTCGLLIPSFNYEHVCVGPNNHLQSRIPRPSRTVTANNIDQALVLPSGYPTGGHHRSARFRGPDSHIDRPITETFGCGSILANFGDCDGRLRTSVEVSRDIICDLSDCSIRCLCIIKPWQSRTYKGVGRCLSFLRKIDTVSSTFRL